MEKKTQKDFYADIVELALANDRKDIADFAQGRIDLLAKKSASKKPTKTQEANEGLKKSIVEALGSDKLTVTEILAKVAPMYPDTTLSNQKVTALVRQLVLDGVLARNANGKRTEFSIVVDEDEEQGTEDVDLDTEVDEA